MKDKSILFFSEESSFKIKNERIVKKWILNTINEYNRNIHQINIIFCSDQYLKKINSDFLNHDYYTDIITFNNSDAPDTIATDIFISIDRIKDNSIIHKVTFNSELHRVIIHGILHLLDYNDKTSQERMEMCKAENKYLSKLNII